MNNDSLLKYLKLSLFVTIITLAFILVPSFALISSSQSNNTVVEETSSTETSFSFLSRELAENQSESGDKSDEEADD